VAKLWSGIITETITRHVVVEANTREEAAHQLAEGFIVYELQEWKEEQSRRLTREFTKSMKKRARKGQDSEEGCLSGCEDSSSIQTEQRQWTESN
jgi:hypothetical protein